MTNEELEELQEKLHADFENNKMIVYDAYLKMGKASEEFMKINDILNKREEKTEGNEQHTTSQS